jgi:palmitoyl-[glycerolipid] 3-(E)-desaturase
VAVHYLVSAWALVGFAGNIPLDTPGHVAGLGGLLVFAVVFSDFFSGLFHWSVDNYGDGSTPILGSVIAAFQGHHDAPWTITYRQFCNNVYKICKVTIPALLLVKFLVASPLAGLFAVIFFNLQVLSQE